jgi:hypothetical protein
MEIQSLTGNEDNSLYIRNYKNGLDGYKKRIQKASENIEDHKKLSKLINSPTHQNNSQTEKLINADSLSWKLESAKRIGIETESVSLEICKDLHAQSEKMYGIKEKVSNINEELTSGNNLLKRIMRRENRNKTIIIMFSVFLFISLLLIAYFKYANGDKEATEQ